VGRGKKPVKFKGGGRGRVRPDTGDTNNTKGRKEGKKER